MYWEGLGQALADSVPHGKHLEVVGVACPTAGLEALLETILVWILYDCEIGIPVISIGDDSMWKLCPELLQLGLEDKVMAIGLVVCTLHTSYTVSVVFGS